MERGMDLYIINAKLMSVMKDLLFKTPILPLRAIPQSTQCVSLEGPIS